MASRWDADNMPDQDEDVSYYAVLNVARDASTEDISKAYRKLAQVFHPDKHTRDDLKASAQFTFSKLQEAYEVLSNPSKREIYDVYGKTGLEAGLEVGDHLKGAAELKREWEEFQKKREAERQEALTNHRGSYLCRLDATRLVDQGMAGLKDLAAGDWSQAPRFQTVVVQNSIDAPLGDRDMVQIQGQAILRDNRGYGNFIFGYKRVLSQNDTLDAQAVLGLRSLLSLSSTRQLGTYTTATLSGTWSPDDGLGLQVQTSRHLPWNMQGTLMWVVGPPGASGVSLQLVKRSGKYALSGKVEVGAITALFGRVSYAVSDSLSVRAVARLGVTGIDFEVGANKRWSPHSVGYMGAVVGLQGILVKLHFTRGGQTFQFPILLSSHYTDWRVLLAAYTVPPVLYLASSRFVIRPLLAWNRKRRELHAQSEYASQVLEGLKEADIEQALIAPVARRKARAEAARNNGSGGLVILEAVYGALEDYTAAVAAQPDVIPAAAHQRQAAAAAPAAEAAPAAAFATAAVAPAQASTADEQTASSAAQAAGAHERSSSAAGRPPCDDSSGAASSSQQQPPGLSCWWLGKEQAAPVAPAAWMRGTAALQYLVVDGKLVLFEGVPKSGLMGFTDPAPKASSKQLYIAFYHEGVVYQVTVGDKEKLELPGAGEVVADAVRVQALLSAASAEWGTELISQQTGAGLPMTGS